MGIKSKIIVFLVTFFPKELAVFLLATLPIFELRLAVPVGLLKFKMSVLEVYMLSVLGNMLPVIPLLYFLNIFFHRMENIPFYGKIFQWWFKRVERKSKIVQKWGFWGLVVFVSIPFPGTGAWTGSLAAVLVEMRFRKALFAIFLGVIIAGILVSSLSVAANQAVKVWIDSF